MFELTLNLTFTTAFTIAVTASAAIPKKNRIKVPSEREADIKCEILQSAMIQAQGKRKHEDKEPNPDVGRKEKCIAQRR